MLCKYNFPEVGSFAYDIIALLRSQIIIIFHCLFLFRSRLPKLLARE